MKRLQVLGHSLDLKLSPTFIQNAACPLYLKLHYVDKVDERYIRVAAERGKAAHEAIAELTRFCHENQIQPDKLEDEDLRLAVQKFTPPTIMAEVSSIFIWVKLWAERFKISKHLYGFEEKIALNESFEECRWDEASYRGILDVTDINGSRCTITDYKSQPYIMNQTELDEHEQMTMYCWLNSKLYDFIDSFTVRIWYLRYGFYAETTRTLEDIAVFEQALMIKERKIQEISNWNPIPGKHCQYCEFIHLCPLSRGEGLGSDPIISQEQAVDAAKRITVMGAYTAELKQKLKEYVNHNDNVRISDKYVFGFRHVEQTYWDPKEVEQILYDYDALELGHSLAEIVNIDKRGMNKLLKELARENPALEAALAEAVKVKHSTRFEGSSPGADGEANEVD